MRYMKCILSVCLCFAVTACGGDPSTDETGSMEGQGDMGQATDGASFSDGQLAADVSMSGVPMDGGGPADLGPAGDAEMTVDALLLLDAANPITIDYQGESNVGNCAPHQQDTTRYATVGFWRTSDCSGEPVAENAFPINETAGCYCWPGRSGQNSADSFTCDPVAGTISITQYGSLECSEERRPGTRKVFHSDRCTQDIPPTLYSRVLDMGPCRTGAAD